MKAKNTLSRLFVPACLLFTTTFVQMAVAQQISPDPTAIWQTWQNAGAATVRTPQLRDGNVYKLTPAEIIYYAGLENNVNPVLLLVKMQHEQNLLSSNFAGSNLQNVLNRATGFGVFDRDPSNTKWIGFYPQLVAASYQFGDLWKKTYKSSADAIAKYSTDPNAGAIVSRVYADYANRMNRIVGSNYSTAPTGWGHVDDFKGVVSPAHIQAFLEQFPGPLKNRNLFSGSGTTSQTTNSATTTQGVAVNTVNVQPQSIQTDQQVQFTVQTATRAKSVRLVFDTMTNGASVNLENPTGDGLNWRLARAITQAGVASNGYKRPVWVIAQDAAGKDGAAKPVDLVVTPKVDAKPQVVAPLSPLPKPTQNFANALNYKTSACYFKGFHTGVDYAPVAVGQSVMAIADGNVVKVGQAGKTAGTLGSYVVVEHPQLGLRSYYVHITPTVGVGTQVKAGDKIAGIAATTAVGKHLHLEIQKSGFRILDANNKERLFVGRGTTPIGNCGYVSRSADLAKGWIDPANFLKHPIASFSAGQEQSNSEDLEEDDFPAPNDQKRRADVVAQILAELAKKRYQFAGTTDAQANAAGLITGASLSQPQDTVSRMEMALFVYRLLKKWTPTVLPSSTANRFPIEEFKDTSEANAAEYQQVVNTLVAAGIVNGATDGNGEQRFYPTRKASTSEIQAFIDRAMSKIPNKESTQLNSVQIQNVGVNPAVVQMNQSMTFSVSVDNASDVQRVDLVFTDVGAVEQMAQNGNTFTRQRVMGTAGNNRPYEVRVYKKSTGQAVTRQGSYSVQAVQLGGGQLTSNPVITTPAMSSVQPQGQVMLNQPAVFMFEGKNLTSAVLVTVGNCDQAQTQLLSATQIRHQCIPRTAGQQQAGWKANVGDSLHAIGMVNVAQPQQVQPPQPLATPAVSIVGISAMPSSVQAGQNMNFVANLNSAQGVSKVELVFPNANVTEPMTQAGTQWSRNRVMSAVGTNPFQIRVTLSNGQVQIQNGTYTVMAASAVPIAPIAPVVQTPQPVITTPAMSSVQPQGQVMLNQPATFVFEGKNLTPAILVTVSNCDQAQTQLLSATQIRHQCIPRTAGQQQAGWKANAGDSLHAIGNVNVMQAAIPAVNITGIGANPSVVQMNQSMTFSVSVDNASDVQRVDLVFTDVGAVEQMAQNGNTFTRQRVMGTAGNNRPYEVRVYKKSTGQAVTRQGSYSVQAVQQPVVQPPVPVQQPVLQPIPQAVPSTQPVVQQPQSGIVPNAVGCVVNNALPPVCGMDNRTYPNTCTMLKAGVARKKVGAC